MSRNREFGGILVQPYIGVPFASPVQTLLNKFGQQPPFPPTTIPLHFDWISYGAGTARPNVQALVNANATGGSRPPLDKIFSVRVDNLGNAVPIYIYFPDTGYTVVCPPNAVTWENVETAQFSLFIIGEGFTDASALAGATDVYVCNFRALPFVSFEFQQIAALFKASASISRGGTILNQNFGVPALGDQFTQPLVSVQTDGQEVQVFPVLQQGFYYITSLVTICNISSNSGGNGNAVSIFESTGSAGEFMNLQVFLPSQTGGQTQPFINSQLFNSGSVQWKIDATQLWRVRVDASRIGSLEGSMQWNFSFTSNPN